MKIAALFDAQGRILAASAMEESDSGPIPVASEDTEDTETEVFDVPESGSGLRLDEICADFRVDTDSKRLYDTREAAS